MARDDAAPTLPGFGEGEMSPHGTPTVRRAFEIYDDFAKANKWVVTTVLDEGRQRAIKKALVTYMGLDGWQKQLEKATKSDFLMGRVAPKPGYRQFKMHLDFLLQPKSIRSLIDGLYNGDDGGHEVKPGQTVTASAINWRAQLEKYRAGRWWPGTFGPRPEEPGPHQAPAEMIEEWCRKHGMAGHNGPPIETLEERLAASIATYRKVGQYDRANVIEERLAGLLGRPPVLVPAPEVAQFGMEQGKTRPPTNGHFAGKSAPGGRIRVDMGKTSPVTDVPSDEPPPWSGDVPEGAEHEHAD